MEKEENEILELLNPTDYAPELQEQVAKINEKINSVTRQIEVNVDESSLSYQLNKQKSVIESISAIYTCLYAIDLEDGTFEEILAKDEYIATAVGKRGIAQDSLNFLCANIMAMNHISDMFDFLQLDTLNERLIKYDSVSREYFGIDGDWKETIFIAMDRDSNGNCKKVLWGFRTINDEKEKELELTEKSIKDELTGLFNRRAFDNDVEELEENGIPKDFVFVSIDVNGLKIVNDTLGHEAGDELLLGATECMKQAFNPYGKVYRTGGDEFVAMIRATDFVLESIKNDLIDLTSKWTGNIVDKVAVSCGYVQKSEADFETISEISSLADKRMYEDKTAYYKRQGVDRKGQAVAYTALYKLYTKILKVNLSEDSYIIFNMDVTEQSEDKGFSPKISEWLSGFGKSGQVHEEDLDKYLMKTDIEYLKDYFNQGNTMLKIHYRRKILDTYKLVVMEMIPADDYSDDNQTLFLYVKNIDM